MKEGGLKKAKKWIMASRRNIVVVVIAAVLLLSGAAAGLAMSPLGLSGGDIDVDPVDNYYLVDKEEFSDVLLPKTADAGDAYQNETLFIGDSNTLRMYMFEMLTLENMIGIESIGIIGARQSECVYFEGRNEPVTIAEAVKLMKPRRVVICIGTNDLPHVSQQDYIENYSKFIDEIQAAYPYADIIISAIPPFAARMEGVLKLSKLNSFNVALVELAREKNVKFVDIGEALTGTDGYIKPEYIYSDGIHITESAAAAWLKYVRTHAYETEDQRPKPLGTIPTQKYIPVFYPGSGTGEQEEFDLEMVLSSTKVMLQNYGFTIAPENADMTGATAYPYKQTATLDPGQEETMAKDIYLYFLSASKATQGDISLSYTETDADWTFTIRYMPHKVDDTKWVEEKEATCTAVGKETNTCQTCGKKIEREIPKKEHDYGEWQETPGADCTKEGTRKRVCKVCGHEEKENMGPGPHSYGAWVESPGADCQTEGFKRRTCSICGHVEQESLGYGPHSYGTWQEYPSSTCLEEGFRVRVCTKCGHEQRESLGYGPHGTPDEHGACPYCGQTIGSP